MLTITCLEGNFNSGCRNFSGLRNARELSGRKL